MLFLLLKQLLQLLHLLSQQLAVFLYDILFVLEELVFILQIFNQFLLVGLARWLSWFIIRLLIVVVVVILARSNVEISCLLFKTGLPHVWVVALQIETTVLGRIDLFWGYSHLLMIKQGQTHVRIRYLTHRLFMRQRRYYHQITLVAFTRHVVLKLNFLFTHLPGRPLTVNDCALRNAPLRWPFDCTFAIRSGTHHSFLD